MTVRDVRRLDSLIVLLLVATVAVAAALLVRPSDAAPPCTHGLSSVAIELSPDGTVSTVEAPTTELCLP